MDSTLTVSLMLDADCNLVALDDSDYEGTFTEITTHAIVEFLQDVADNIINQRVHTITGPTDPLIRTSLPMELSSDGIQIYYRLVIPTLEHYLEDGIYKVANRFFCYEDKIYYSEVNLLRFNEQSVQLIDNYIILWNARHDDNQLYWYNDKVFTICKLNNCLLNRIREDINRTVRNGCDFVCSKDNIEQAKTDFLLESSFALKYLTEQGRFEDAQRVLTTILGCGKICSNSTLTSSTGCNCGKTS